MLIFNEAAFNECAFNADDECFVPVSKWEIFLNPETDNTLIANGTGAEIPPNLLFPGQLYRILRSEGGERCAFDLRTPPAITFDELGG